MCFLRKFKWNFLPWNKCTCRISVCFLKGFFEQSIYVEELLRKKKKHNGRKGNGKNIMSRYNLTLSKMCSYNLMLFFSVSFPAEMVFSDSQKTFSKLFMHFKRFGLLWVLPFLFLWLVNNAVRNLSLPAMCLWIISWRV